MQNTLLITITTAQGRPTIEVPASSSHTAISKIVRRLFGAQDNQGTLSLPHSYCGKLTKDVSVPVLSASALSQDQKYLVQPGHLRVF